MEEEEYSMLNGYIDSGSLLADAQGVTHNFEDDDAETGTMPAS